MTSHKTIIAYLYFRYGMICSYETLPLSVNSLAKKSVPKIQDSFVSRIFTVGFGNLIGQMAIVLSTPIITRLYPPSVYAEWALGMGFITIFGSISTLRYELAIVLPAEKRHSANLFALSIALATLSGILTAITFIPLEYPLRTFFGIERNDLNWIWIPVAIALTGISQSCQHWFTREKDFKKLAFLASLSATFISVGQIIFFFFGRKDFEGLVWGSLFGQGLSTLWGLTIILVENGREFRQLIALDSAWRMAKNYRSYPLFITPYSLVGVIREKASLFVLNLFGSASLVGSFSLASRVMNFPVDLISGSLRPVLFQMASERKTKQMDDLMSELLNSLIKMSVPFWIFFLFYYQELFEFFFGSAWSEAGLYAAILSVPAIAFLLSDWSDRLLDVMGQQKLALKLEVFFTVFGLTLVFGILSLTKNFFHAVIVHAAVVLAFNLYWLYAVYRQAKFNLMNLSKLMRVFLFTSLSWGLLLMGLSKLAASPIVFLFYGIATIVNLAICFKPLRTKLA